MPKYIDTDAFMGLKREWYCKQCEKRKGMKRGKLQFVYEIGDAPCRACDVDDMISDIEDFPAADVEPKQKWIPVTERLPETNEKVLVWVYDPDFYKPYMDFGYWLNEIEAWGEYNDEVGDFKYYTIIAWMPLPEPPKEDDDE